MAGRIFITGASIVLIATGIALASETKYDRTIEMAAAKIAAEKLGDIRGSIGHDETPELVTRELLDKEEQQTDLLPRPVWIPPRGEKALPPMVKNILSELDYTLTGSINGKQLKHTKRIIWEKFDKYGNRID